MLKNLLIYPTAVVLFLVALLAIALVVFHQLPVVGGNADSGTNKKMFESANFDGKTFNNLLPTSVSTRDENSPSVWQFIRAKLSPAEGKNPVKPLENQGFDSTKLAANQLAWLGHSTVYFKTGGLNVVTDPVFYCASPLPIGGQPFNYQSPYTSDDVADADVVVISHDHYDHLEMRTIKELADKVKTFLVPLGVKAHLTKWGVSVEKVIELDWYQSHVIQGVTFTLTPSRHFSGRGLFNRDKTLWGSWVVKSHDFNLYFSGDGGYSPEFKKIGELYGPFDIALMENGAYNHDWQQIHMFPEQSMQAGVDLQAKAVLPIHWGKFDLAPHQWLEPLQRAQAAAADKAFNLLTPKIGEVFSPQSDT